MSQSSAAKLSALAATAVAALAIGASSASAFVLANPCSQSGPTIVDTGPSVIGSCFSPYAEVQVRFWYSYGSGHIWDPVESVWALVTGTISVPMLSDPESAAEQEHIIAAEGNYPYTLSNVITILPQTAQ